MWYRVGLSAPVLNHVCCNRSHLRMVCFLFQRLGVLHVGQKLEEQNEFEKIYKNGR